MVETEGNVRICRECSEYAPETGHDVREGYGKCTHHHPSQGVSVQKDESCRYGLLREGLEEFGLEQEILGSEHEQTSPSRKPETRSGSPLDTKQTIRKSISGI